MVMPRLFHILILLSFTGTAVAGSPVSVPVSAPLTWADALRILSENNQELKAQTGEVEAARLRQNGAANGYFPQISAALSYNQTDNQSPVAGLVGVYGANLILTQNLFTGFADQARVDWARANKTSAEINLTLLKSRLTKDLKTAFENYLFAVRSIDLRKSIVKRREDNVRLVELRFRGGRENRGSVLLSTANLSESRYEQNQAELWLGQYRAALGKVLGLDESSELEIAGEVPVKAPPSAHLKINDMARKTPLVEHALYDVDMADAGLTIARSGFYPSLALAAGVNRNDDRFFPEATRNWNVGLTLTIPLFNGGKDYYETKAQTQAVVSAAARREQAVKESLDLLSTARSNYLQAVERVQVNESFVQAASVRAEIGRMRYNNGLISFEDWYLIENELIDRQKRTLESQRDRVLFEAAWDDAQGVGLLP